jgi:hypothetical protein
VQETFVTPALQQSQVAAHRVALFAAFCRVEVFMIKVGSHDPSRFLRKLSFLPRAQNSSRMGTSDIDEDRKMVVDRELREVANLRDGRECYLAIVSKP